MNSLRLAMNYRLASGNLQHLHGPYSIEKVRRLPTQQEGPKGVENFLASGTIVSLVRDTSTFRMYDRSGNAVPIFGHASLRRGRFRKAGETVIR